MTWRAEKWSDAIRHEPNRSLSQSEAAAFMGLTRTSSIATVRRLILRRHGRHSPVLKEFNKLLAHRTTPKMRVDPVITNEQRKEILELAAQEGWPASRIASKLRLRHWRVAALLRQSRGELGRRERLTQEMTLNVMRAIERGDQTIAEISVCFHVPMVNVLRIARNVRSRLTQG
jgi:hypothetical protein